MPFEKKIFLDNHTCALLPTTLRMCKETYAIQLETKICYPPLENNTRPLLLLITLTCPKNPTSFIICKETIRGQNIVLKCRKESSHKMVA
jgi:hypothetical protein